MKAKCERCQTHLNPASKATICSFECTFCPACAAQMNHVCPNCGGELVPRPRRVKSVTGAVLHRVRSGVRR